MSLLDDFTHPYSRIEAWAYDRFIAPAVESFQSALQEEFLARVPRGAAVLDVGCGGGQALLALARQRPDLTLTGVDLSAQQIARARRRCADFAERCHFTEGNALALPFEAARFGAVLSIASIKHWPDPAQGLRESLRVLEPGGLLWVVEADRGCKLEDCRRFVARMRVPAFVRPLLLPGFRTFVAGQSFDRDEARALLAGLDVAQAEVCAIEGLPAFRMSARKTGG